MRTLLLLVVLAVAVTVLAAPLGLAASGSNSDPRGDVSDEPQSGSRSSLDLVRGTYALRSGRLVHTLTVAGSVANPASGGEGVPMLYLQTPSAANGTSECAFFVGRHRGRLGVFTCGYGERVASARVTRSSASTIRFEFSPRAIGNPATYEWAGAMPAGRTRYAGAWSHIDRMPTGTDEYFTHRVR